MGAAIGDALPFAVGVALSPIPITAVILMLFSKRARSLGPAFVIGWILGVTIIAVFAFLLAGSNSIGGNDNSPSTAISVVRLVLGVSLLLLAVKEWRDRPTEGEPDQLPTWLNSIDNFSPPKALGIALVLAGPSPKNLALTVAGAVSIANYVLSDSEDVLSLSIFVIIASVTVVVPVTWYFVAPDSALPALSRWRDWLERSNSAVATVMLLLFGIILLGKGLGGLTS